MYKISVLIIMILFITGCSHHIQPDSTQNIEKINARVLVYIPDNFKEIQSDPTAIIRALSFNFNEPVTKFLPAFFNDTFVKVDFTDIKAAIGDDHDFLAVPEFDNVSFYSDRTFGHELRVNVSIIFTPANHSDPIIVKGTGLARDLYGGKTIYEQDLANQAFADVLEELQKNIQNQRADFENTEQ